VSDARQRFLDGLNFDLKLVGKHASLEPLDESHSQALCEAASDGKLWELPFTSVPSPELMLSRIEDALKNREEGKQLPFVVRRLADQKIVGATRYYSLEPDHRNLSIGYTWYAASAQRTAINTECKLMLLTHAFEKLRCISVQWHTDNQNKRSQTAIQRLGAQFEGVLRNHIIMPDGRYRHTHCYSMLDTEWPEAKAFLTQRLAQ